MVCLISKAGHSLSNVSNIRFGLSTRCKKALQRGSLRLAGRNQPVLPLVLKKNEEQQISGLLLSFSIRGIKFNFVSNL
jgi:hypothetical protein